MQAQQSCGPLAFLVLFSVVGLTFSCCSCLSRTAARAGVRIARLSGPVQWWMIECREMMRARFLPAELLPRPAPACCLHLPGIARRRSRAGVSASSRQAHCLARLLAFHVSFLLKSANLSDKLKCRLSQSPPRPCARTAIFGARCTATADQDGGPVPATG